MLALGAARCTHDALLARPPLTCFVVWFPTGHGLAPVHSPGAGDPCSTGLSPSALWECQRWPHPTEKPGSEAVSFARVTRVA